MASHSDRVTRLKIAYVLYLDIVGYSLLRVNQQLSLVNELTELVRGADEFLRAESYGDLITLPTGDGMALVFLNEPEAPVLCALEIAERLRTQSQIQLRMGIHYGPIRLNEDISGKRNVVGNGINQAQRVMDCGDGGHILLSPMAAEVLRLSGDWEPYIEDLGECEIKHGQLLRVFNLVRDGLGNSARPTKLASVTPEPEPPIQMPIASLQVEPKQDILPQMETPEPPVTKDGAELVYIPAGVFWMGDDDLSDNPRREVTLDAYWIYKVPVTVAQYLAFCNATSHTEPPRPSWGWQDTHPIVNVSWEDAQAYCQWAGAELPTEAQWERAARGTGGNRYPWGNRWIAGKCNNWETGPERTTPVGSYPQGASPDGVLDMAGNVWEWVWDWYTEDYDKQGENHNPRGPVSSPHGFRALRGGSWNHDIVGNFRCAYRYWDYPSLWLNHVGFRCVVRADTG